MYKGTEPELSRMMSTWQRVSILCCLFGLLTLLPGLAHADDFTWTGTTNGNWNTGTNWTTTGVSGRTFPDDATDTATFDNNTQLTVTLTGAVTVNRVTIGANSGNRTITGSTLTLGGTTPTVDVASGKTLTLNSIVAGSAGLTKAGTGTLLLATNNTTVNTFTGGVFIDAGVLTAGSLTSGTGSALGGATNVVTLGGANALGATFQVNRNQNYPNPIIVNAASTGVLRIAGGPGLTVIQTPTITAAITLNNNLTLGNGAGGSVGGVVLGGVITGSGTITVDGAASGTFGTGTIAAISSNNAATFTGNVVVNRGILGLRNNGALGASSTVAVATDAILDLSSNNNGAGNTNVFSVSVAGLNNVAGSGGTVTTNTTGTGTATLTLAGSGSGTYTFSGTITQSATGRTALIKSGSGTQILNGANTYTGGTTATGGTLAGTGVLGGPTNFASGSTHAPGVSGPGIQPVNGNYTQNGALAVDLNGATAGTEYDQVNVTGAVFLGGTFNITTGFTPSPGASFTIINNDGTDAVNGTFLGVPQGSTVSSSGGTVFSINYQGGDGNDVVLTVGGSVWSAIGTAVDGANQTKILWRNASTGQMSLWIVNAAGTPTKKINFGPFAGWTVLDVAAGQENTQILWQATNGYVALWRVNDAAATGGVADDPATSNGISSFVYGPFGSGNTAWNAQKISVDVNGITRLMWRRADGALGLWTVSSGFSVTSFVFGPYASWIPVDIAAVSDGGTRVLWQGTDGQVSLWSVTFAGAVTSVNYGPYAGWNASRIALDSGSNTHIMWQRNDGALGLWTVDPAGALVSSFIYGPYAGWSATDVGAGTENTTSHVVWNNTNGTVALWIVNSAGQVTSFTYGPGPS